MVIMLFETHQLSFELDFDAVLLEVIAQDSTSSVLS